MVNEDIANNKDECLITENKVALIKLLLPHKYFILDFMTDKASEDKPRGKLKWVKMGAKSLRIKSTNISRPYVTMKLTDITEKRERGKKVIKVLDGRDTKEEIQAEGKK